MEELIQAAFRVVVQGHLLIAATRQEGHRQPPALDWLTSHQWVELERQFEAVHLALARASWQRSAELRAEYEAKYLRLKGRLTAVCLTLAATAVPLALLLLAPLRR